MVTIVKLIYVLVTCYVFFCCRNAFDIARKDVLSQISKMKANFLQVGSSGLRLQDEEKMHNIPVQDMGNYQEHLKKMPQPLREIETQPVRQHTFGNPFKVNKVSLNLLLIILRLLN